MLFEIACSLIAALSLAAAVPADTPPAKKGPAELQGTWKLVSVEINGKPFDVGQGQPRWAIKGDKIRYAGEDLAVLTADPKATPKTLDLSFLSPKKAYEGIYTVEKDTLKICLNGQSDGLKERPQDFSTKDKANLRLLVFERDKADADTTEGLTGFVGLSMRLDDKQNAVVVNEAFDGSPAKKAGLRKDDVLLKVGGGEVTDLRSVIDTVRQAKPGNKLEFRIRRDGKEKDVTVKVGTLPFGILAQLE